MAKRFTSQVATLRKGERYGSVDIDSGKLATRILPHLNGGELFAYLFRRFGYSPFAWDDHKDLCQYYLTTSMSNVFLVVRPYMGADHEGFDRSQLMFGCFVSHAIEEEYYVCLHQEGHAAWIEHPRYKEIEQALEATMRDLLRPVYVRDVPINCYGKVTENKKMLPAVEAYHAAGYPIPTAFFKNIERWEQFIDALSKLGDESLDEGIDVVIKIVASASEVSSTNRRALNYLQEEAAQKPVPSS